MIDQSLKSITDSLSRIAVALESLSSARNVDAVGVAVPLADLAGAEAPTADKPKRRGRPKKDVEPVVPVAPAAPAAPVAPAPAVVVAEMAQPAAVQGAQALTHEVVKQRLSDLMQGNPQVINLVRSTLANFGAPRVSDLQVADLGDFLERVEALL